MKDMMKKSVLMIEKYMTLKHCAPVVQCVEMLVQMIFKGEYMNLKKCTNNEIREEFISRFKLREGLLLNTSRKTSEHIIAFFQTISLDVESFVITYLNGQNRLIDTELLFTGTVNTAAIYPRIVIENIINKKAVGIILAHNHPSGSLTPSSSDRVITEKIKTACKSIDVDLLDHIIIGKGLDYYSFADSMIL